MSLVIHPSLTNPKPVHVLAMVLFVFELTMVLGLLSELFLVFGLRTNVAPLLGAKLSLLST